MKCVIDTDSWWFHGEIHEKNATDRQMCLPQNYWKSEYLQEIEISCINIWEIILSFTRQTIYTYNSSLT